ncbi:hypothetical protein B0H19DRAFT_1116431 [Mycena capillaripes]|nr:hypothetical protein B0H19DRAFT_1116431 [Mycena capillaripes]
MAGAALASYRFPPSPTTTLSSPSSSSQQQKGGPEARPIHTSFVPVHEASPPPHSRPGVGVSTHLRISGTLRGQTCRAKGTRDGEGARQGKGGARLQHAAYHLFGDGRLPADAFSLFPLDAEWVSSSPIPTASFTSTSTAAAAVLSSKLKRSYPHERRHTHPQISVPFLLRGGARRPRSPRPRDACDAPFPAAHLPASRTPLGGGGMGVAA